MLIKSPEASDHEANLRESFENLRNQRGIEPNPNKIGGTTVDREVDRVVGRLYMPCKVPYLSSMPEKRDETSSGTQNLYLAVSESALSSVMIREKDKVQWSVYFVSRLMRGAETRYPLTEKMVFALIVAARKLKHYFEANPIEVITDQPLRKILENPSFSG
ncbi:hypothetical protein LIER_14197 [Lithospermum erythrorhizon]|uniref:Reverse transcriptase RNase H-like domain-containing protein n=1 Tax=Lithospermum erythrorhizon TaxID=34254 RepID=A0AAV3Q0I1_LITER